MSNIKQSGILIPSELVSMELREQLDGIKRETRAPIKRICIEALMIGLNSKELYKKLK